MLHFKNKDQFNQFALNLNNWVDKAINEHIKENPDQLVTIWSRSINSDYWLIERTHPLSYIYNIYNSDEWVKDGRIYKTFEPGKNPNN